MGKKNIYTIPVIVLFIVAGCIQFSGCTAATTNTQAACAASIKAAPPEVPMIPPVLIGKFKIEGSGFKPEDRVEIVLAGVDKGKDLPVASAEADASGNFVTSIPPVTVLQGIFHLKFVRGKPTPDPSNPPLPPGSYTLKAVSWDSPCKASCSFKLLAPPKPPAKKK